MNAFKYLFQSLRNNPIPLSCAFCRYVLRIRYVPRIVPEHFLYINSRRTSNCSRSFDFSTFDTYLDELIDHIRYVLRIVLGRSIDRIQYVLRIMVSEPWFRWAFSSFFVQPFHPYLVFPNTCFSGSLIMFLFSISLSCFHRHHYCFAACHPNCLWHHCSLSEAFRASSITSLPLSRVSSSKHKRLLNSQVVFRFSNHQFINLFIPIQLQVPFIEYLSSGNCPQIFFFFFLPP